MVLRGENIYQGGKRGRKLDPLGIPPSRGRGGKRGRWGEEKADCNPGKSLGKTYES